MALIDKLTAIANAIRAKTGKTDKMSLDQMVTEIDSISGGGGGLPSGFSKIACGTHVLASDISSNSSTTSQYMFNVKHSLGVTPDLILFYAPSNIAVTYSELFMAWSPIFEYRSTYPTITAYHSNSTTTVSGGSNAEAYCIRDVNASSFNVKTHSNSNYYWRAGTYKWIAIKFG